MGTDYNNAPRLRVALPLQRVFATLAIVLVPVFAFADGHAWLPVEKSDLEMHEFAKVPGAEAVQLYYANEIDDVAHTEFFYSRIKILTDAGRRHATVEIPMFSRTELLDVAGRTIHPDGSITELTDRPFQKTVYKGKGIKLLVQAFTLPQVTAGSLIEYRYTLKYHEKGYYLHRWLVQHNLFTVKEHFALHLDKHASLSWVKTPELAGEPQQTGDNFQMDKENVPAFEPEEQMPPEESFKLQVKFFYTSAFNRSASEYWYHMGRWFSDGIDYYIGNSKEIKQAASEATEGAATDDQKVRKLYARAQEIRNLSYERRRSEKEKKQEELKPNKSAADVLKHGYGSRDDVTRFFVAMARAAGLRSSVVFVSSRESRLFDKDVLTFGQLDSEIAEVHVSGKTVYLDPGTRFCPYGLVRWMRTGTAAMDMADPGGLFATPGANNESAIMNRSATVALRPDGSLKGDLYVSYTGGEALERRLSALDTDEAGRKKELEEEVKNWLPAHAKVQLTASDGWEKEYEPLTATFEIDLPEFASVAGKRLLVPVTLFQQNKKKRAFKDGPRKYPIYYHYPFTEEDHVTLQLPDGYSAESLIQPLAAKLPYARFTTTATAAGTRVQMERSLAFNGIFFQPNHYDELKDFFNKVQAGDDQQIVLQATASASREASQK
jgi:transglutaminase superfamily protein